MEYVKTFRRMIIIGVVTLLIGMLVNQFMAKGIRLPVLFTSLLPCPFTGYAEYISADDALKLLNEKQAAFIDIRSLDEFDMDHIEGAVSIPAVDFISNPKLLKSYDKDKELYAILYGAKKIEDNAELMSRSLSAKGVQNIKILDGGFELWLKKDYPVEF